MDAAAVSGAILHSAWLLPVLAVMIAVDGPMPVLPSETLLLTAVAVGLGQHDVPSLAALYLAAVVGSVSGDLLVFGLGRSSRQVFAAATDKEHRFAGWVRRNVLHRPGVTMVGARFVPAGRLVSTAAAGRFGLTLPVFLSWSLASSTAWSAYMFLVAVVINPVTDGSPVAALLAGVAIAVISGGIFSAVNAIWARRPALALARGR